MTSLSRYCLGCFGLIVLSAASMPGCCMDARGVAGKLDQIAKSIDRYGFASVSTPFLAKPTDELRFDLKQKADYYYQQAFQPQGAVRNFSAQALDVQFAFRMNIEQALATIAQFNRAKSIAEFREAKRQCGTQKALFG